MLERRRRQIYFTEKLALSVFVLAGALCFLALRDVPSPVEAALFGLLCLQLVAAAVVRSGSLFVAHAISLAGLAGGAMILALAVRGGGPVSLAWAALIAIDPILLFDERRSASVGPVLAFVVGLAALVAVPVAAAPATLAGASAIFAALALAAIGFRICRLFAEAQRQGADQQRFSKALIEAAGVEFALFDRNGMLRRRLRARPEPYDVLDEASGDSFLKALTVVDRTAFLRLLHDAATASERCTITLKAPAAALCGRPLLLQACAVDVAAEAGTIMVALQATPAGTGAEPATAPLSHALALAPLAPQRTDFLANMSHELRTPLNAIIGFSEMLASQTIRPIEQAKQREYAGIIHQSGQHLLAVINDLLDVSRLQAGTFALAREVFDASATVQQCCAAIATVAGEAAVLIGENTAEPGLHVDGDRRALKQIVTKLLSNAVKFTPTGGRVEVATSRDGDVLVISVTDTGIGMSAGDMEQLGRPFFQVRSSLSRPYQGSGLGLSVVRGLVSLHDGTLDVRSSPGHGTTMTVRLPLCRHEPATANDGDDRVVAYRPPEHRTFDRLSDRLGERIDPARHSPSHSPRIKQIA